MSDPESSERPLGWERRELPAGLLLVGLGVLGVVLGWRAAMAAGDVGGQLSALILGGCGGIVLVIMGTGLVQAHVASRTGRDLAGKLDAVARALSDLAGLESPPHEDYAEGDADRQAEMFMATKSTYHVRTCRLVRDLSDPELITQSQAEERRLRPCGVCAP